MILERDRWPELALILDTARSSGMTRSEDLASFLIDNPGIGSPPGSDPRIGIPAGGLRIRYVIVDGFGSYGVKTRMDLKDGLTLVTGDNGSGKTTLLKAVLWCFFGDVGSSDPWSKDIDPSGRKIINWDRMKMGEETASVEIALDIGGKAYRCGRSVEDGKIDHYVYRVDESGKERDSIIPAGLTLEIMPFLIFQGESILFLSHEDPFSSEGPLRRAVMSLSGGSELADLLVLIEGARGKLLSDMERLTETSSPHLEKRLSIIGKIDALDEEIYSVEKAIEETEARIDEVSGDYRSSLADISKLGNPEVGMEKLARKASEMDHSASLITKYLDSAGREILRPLSEESLEKTLAERERKLRSKLLYGAYEAQAEIISEVIRRESCICGTEIGKTGMGRNHLESLHRKILDRKRSVEDWGDHPPWTSDNTLERVRRILASEPFNRRDYLEAVKSYREAVKAESELRSGSSQKAERLEAYLDVIKRYEGFKARARILRQNLKSIRQRRNRAAASLEKVEADMVKLWGTSGGSEVYRNAVALLDAGRGQAVKAIRELLESGRVRLQEEINEILPLLDPDGQYSGCLIHEETFGLGRIRTGSDGGVVPLNRMSAGERELLALAAIFGINRMIGGTLIIDSPFPFLDEQKKKRTILGLSNLTDNGYMSVPTGYLSENDMEDLRTEFQDRGFTHLHIRRSGGSSRINTLTGAADERIGEGGGD
ncbi:MAG: AAA family ATPase [Thermoplasmatota archaeon]